MLQLTYQALNLPARVSTCLQDLEPAHKTFNLPNITAARAVDREFVYIVGPAERFFENVRLA